VRRLVRHLFVLPRQLRTARGAPPRQDLVWIDIEDQADVVGDLDVENFPTLLLQRAGSVAFFGTVLPDPIVADRLVQSQAALADEELARLAASSEERRTWQRDCNLRTLLANAEG
jgi:hypothetical protein